MDAKSAFQRHDGQGSDTLSQYHENRFHPDGTEGNVRAGQADRNKEVGALFLSGKNGSFVNSIWFRWMDADIPLILNETIWFDIALDIV
jgi:hypothetical protein